MKFVFSQNLELEQYKRSYKGWEDSEWVYKVLVTPELRPDLRPQHPPNAKCDGVDL